MSNGLDGRHRDQGGTIDRKRGDTLIRALRQTYGDSFASGRRADMRLETLLAQTGHSSLSDYLDPQGKQR